MTAKPAGRATLSKVFGKDVMDIKTVAELQEFIVSYNQKQEEFQNSIEHLERQLQENKLIEDTKNNKLQKEEEDERRRRAEQRRQLMEIRDDEINLHSEKRKHLEIMFQQEDDAISEKRLKVETLEGQNKELREMIQQKKVNTPVKNFTPRRSYAIDPIAFPNLDTGEFQFPSAPTHIPSTNPESPIVRPPAHISSVLRQLEAELYAIEESIQILRIEILGNRRRERELRAIDEDLTRKLFALDAIDEPTARPKRKELVLFAQELQETLDALKLKLPAVPAE